MTRIVVLLATALALAPVAAAKGDPTEAQLCGASSCRTVTGRAILAALKTYDRPTEEPPPPTPYFTVGPPGRLYHGRIFYVPESGMLAAAVRGQLQTGESFVVWFRLSARERELVAASVRMLEPHSAPAILRVSVAGKTLTGAAAASYERLWREPGEPVAASSVRSGWREIDLRSAAPSPWTVERAELLYAPSANVLERGRTLIRLSDAVAADIEAGRALGGGHGLRPIWPAAALAVLAALAAWWAQRARGTAERAAV